MPGWIQRLILRRNWNNADKLCSSLAAFAKRKVRVSRLGPLSPRTRGFLEANPDVDADARDLLLDASDAVRHAVINEGPLLRTRNPSSALMERVRRNERDGVVANW